MPQTKPLPTMETHSNVAIPIQHTINDKRSNRTNEENRMQRYTKLNDFYILDNYTGQKLNQNQTIRRLNKYDSMLNDETRED